MFPALALQSVEDGALPVSKEAQIDYFKAALVEERRKSEEKEQKLAEMYTLLAQRDSAVRQLTVTASEEHERIAMLEGTLQQHKNGLDSKMAALHSALARERQKEKASHILQQLGEAEAQVEAQASVARSALPDGVLQ
eukprot:CAMPEP_0170641150 /NCGR_PEP_ID=MMETSP0224-20130122/40607_1 /TAXON_ID=285029 /ORGANISM="Togula jolla, Strain CCCM 725" /LENGTH=137 /DNA_ID=CAMNT_0010971709 /DNA_START=62 /DNA_END=472 /DNA_ORIENTATION=+